MENLKINDATRSRGEWMEIAELPEELKANVMAADVLIEMPGDRSVASA